MLLNYICFLIAYGIKAYTLMIHVDYSWTLFLDRDGVINTRIVDDYVTSPQQFHFLPGVLDALLKFDKVFNRIIIVTNQQGIGKEVMTHEQLEEVHNYMSDIVEKYGGRIDAIYYCPHLAVYEPLCRKPNPGMALEAKNDYPDINFTRSIMVGDSKSDILFGNQLGMKTVYISDNQDIKADLLLNGLADLVHHLTLETN